jgi:hypothetical protein
LIERFQWIWGHLLHLVLNRFTECSGVCRWDEGLRKPSLTEALLPYSDEARG